MNITKTTPKDFFMHVLMIVTLYISVGSFLNITFQIINTFFPDPLNFYHDPAAAMRWGLASMVVIFPVFLWASRFLYKDIAKNPEKSELRVRRWLVHFTIFAAAGFIIGDLITLIYNFLEGDLTTRFILKILAVLLVIIAVFGYYLYDLKRKPKEFSKRAKFFVWAVVLFVAAATISGSFIAGSPSRQRALRFDQQRISDLQNIQGQILNHWMQKGKLPADLDELIDSISGFVPPVDPETGDEYFYDPTGNLSFDLCAIFNLPSTEAHFGMTKPMLAEPRIFRGTDNWNHDMGDVCFERIIDPELYPQVKREK